MTPFLIKSRSLPTVSRLLEKNHGFERLKTSEHGPQSPINSPYTYIIIILDKQDFFYTIRKNQSKAERPS